MIMRNYTKDTGGLFAQIIGKISAITIHILTTKMATLLAELDMP